MNYKNIGAHQRQKLSLRYAGNNNRMARQFALPAMLSQLELRRLVAAMVD